jgi:hypothetical protein
MVDSIRRTHPIGVIKPTRQRREVEQHRQPPKERHDRSGDDSQGNEEESATAPAEKQSCPKPDPDANETPGHETPLPTGRCIDVRV